MTALTPFGKAIRHVRLERNVLLGDMAKALNVSSSYVSQIETGVRRVPDGLIDRLEAIYKLSREEIHALEAAAAQSAVDFRIAIRKNAPALDRELGYVLARRFDKLSAADKRRILGIAKKGA